jgi:flagellar assembly factor FliW
MIFNTSSFGYVEIEDTEIINFPEGIYAFGNVKEFAILKQNEDEESPIMWLQAIKDEHLSFVVINPSLFIEDYHPNISEDVFKKLGVINLEDLRYFVIAIVPKNINDMTVNLKSPIIVNSVKNIAMQVILDNSDYPIRYRVFEKSGKVD